MQIRVGIKEDDKDVICRAETELIMSQLKRKNTDITFKKYSIKQEERCNQSNSWLDAVSCAIADGVIAVSYTHLRAHETDSYLVCRLLLEKKKKKKKDIERSLKKKHKSKRDEEKTREKAI